MHMALVHVLVSIGSPLPASGCVALYSVASHLCEDSSSYLKDSPECNSGHLE